MKATQSCSIEDCKRPSYARGWCRPHYSRWRRNGDPIGGKCAPAAVRFERLVDRTGECHRWTGSHHGKGYGHFRYEGRVRKAHVVALLLAGVDVPDGMTVDHVWARGCQHRDCVRVEHLEVVPGAVNILRGGNPCAVNARKLTGWSAWRQAYRVKNSWGPEFGRNGQAYIAADDLNRILFRAGGEAAVPVGRAVA